MTARKPGELTDIEIDALDEQASGYDELLRAIATAAHAKAMKRAAEIAGSEICGCCWTEDQQEAANEIADAIEREAQGE